MIREHAVLRRSLCATLTALIDPLAAPSGAIADGLTPCPVFRAEVMWIGLLGLRLTVRVSRVATLAPSVFKCGIVQGASSDAT